MSAPRDITKEMKVETHSEQFIGQLLQATKEQHYPFIKSRHHFSPEIRYPLPSCQIHHSAYTSQKVPKFPYSISRNSAEWLRIHNLDIHGPTRNRSIRLMILSGEIYRYIDKAPKYRGVHVNSRLDITSKCVHHSEIFHNYFYVNLYPKRKVSYHNDDFVGGMGRSVLANYFCLEHDFNASNALVEISEGLPYFVNIDRGHTFWPISHQFIAIGPKKIVGYQPTKNNITIVPDPNDSFLVVKDKVISYLGELSFDEYDELPLLKDFLPCNWIFMTDGFKTYATWLSKNVSFNNEKHFSSLKLLVAPEIMQFLAHYHLDNQEDKTALQELLVKRTAGLKDACKKSEKFHTYFALNYSKAITTILYETHQFFYDNKHYLPTDKRAWRVIWLLLTNIILDNSAALLKELQLPQLTEVERNDLLTFANHCEYKLVHALPKVISFYDQQYMMHHALTSRRKLKELESSPLQNNHTLFATSYKSKEVIIPKKDVRMFAYLHPNK